MAIINTTSPRQRGLPPAPAPTPATVSVVAEQLPSTPAPATAEVRVVEVAEVPVLPEHAPEESAFSKADFSFLELPERLRVVLEKSGETVGSIRTHIANNTLMRVLGLDGTGRKEDRKTIRLAFEKAS